MQNENLQINLPALIISFSANQKSSRRSFSLQHKNKIHSISALPKKVKLLIFALK